MNTTTDILHTRDLNGRFSVVQRKERYFSFQKTYRISFLEERFLQIKSREIVQELTQIILFIEELERIGIEQFEVLDQFYMLRANVRSMTEGYKHTKIVNVVSKYLAAIRKFLLTTKEKEAAFYKKLFESTVVAMKREIDSPELVVA